MSCASPTLEDQISTLVRKIGRGEATSADKTVYERLALLYSKQLETAARRREAMTCRIAHRTSPEFYIDQEMRGLIGKLVHGSISDYESKRLDYLQRLRVWRMRPAMWGFREPMPQPPPFPRKSWREVVFGSSLFGGLLGLIARLRRPHA